MLKQDAQNQSTIQNPKSKIGLLGDTPQRAYTSKLHLFNEFAAPELRALIGGLGLRNGERVLDAGCGVGLATVWLAEQVAPAGLVVGLDLSAAHVRTAQQQARQAMLPIMLLQGDLDSLPLAQRGFDLVWSSNTINHLRDPLTGTRQLAALLRPGGRLVLGQSLFLPEMFFAWDARLEQRVIEADRRYYRARYGLDERSTGAQRRLVGLLRDAGLQAVRTRTIAIERIAPLTPQDERYFTDAIFLQTWGERLRPYLDDDDWAELAQLCDPDSPAFCLRRPDFHHVQTYTLVIGKV